ncbi:MAG: Gfo/Idh/MocA family oxidoreductase [Verrucomicrobiota bacterium]
MKPIRYAVVGLGHIAQVAILPAFAQAENSELAVLITGDGEKQRKLSEKYGVPAYPYDQFEKALTEQRADAVFIALPNTLHREYTERAAALGVHVLCEKPMATTEADCRAMIQACETADVRLMIAYRLHFNEAHLKAIQLAKKGALGELRFFNSIFAMQVADDNIRMQRETGGGTLFDIGIYCINAARYLFQDEPVEVSAIIASGDDHRFQEIEEMASVVLRFPRERVASFTCSFGSADMNQIDLVGTKGLLRFEPAYKYVGDLKWRVQIGEYIEEKTFPIGDQFAAEIVYFSDCIRGHRTPEPSGLEGLADVLIIRAIFEAAKTARTVSLKRVEDALPGIDQMIQIPASEEQQPVKADDSHQ